MMRRVWAAIAGSCVTKTSVRPRLWFRPSRSCIISAPDFESRFPVGSSGRMSAGSLIEARAPFDAQRHLAQRGDFHIAQAIGLGNAFEFNHRISPDLSGFAPFTSLGGCFGRPDRSKVYGAGVAVAAVLRI